MEDALTSPRVLYAQLPHENYGSDARIAMLPRGAVGSDSALRRRHTDCNLGTSGTGKERCPQGTNPAPQGPERIKHGKGNYELHAGLAQGRGGVEDLWTIVLYPRGLLSRYLTGSTNNLDPGSPKQLHRTQYLVLSA